MIPQPSTTTAQDDQRRKIVRANDMRKAGYALDVIERRVKAKYRSLRRWADELQLVLLP